MKQQKVYQVTILHKENNVTKELTLLPMLTAKDVIHWADRIRELQSQTLDLGFSTKGMITGQAK